MVSFATRINGNYSKTLHLRCLRESRLLNKLVRKYHFITSSIYSRNLCVGFSIFQLVLLCYNDVINLLTVLILLSYLKTCLLLSSTFNTVGFDLVKKNLPIRTTKTWLQYLKYTLDKLLTNCT